MTVSSALTTPGERSDLSQTTIPVIEIFGPTLQGEGPDMGRPAYFVRLGGCDFRCSWCDSMYAVEPAEVRLAERLTEQQIVERVSGLAAGPDLVVLSGGNPALFDLAALSDMFHAAGLEVAVETQGSRWKPWLGHVDRVVVSPKGPSSGMDTAEHRDLLSRFMEQTIDSGAALALKVVIFDTDDLAYARRLAQRWPQVALHLSTGTDVGLDERETADRLRVRLRWLSEAVAGDPVLRHAKVGAQQHVLTWGTRRGV
jgi:7-carboxy-7-deazaguanine synthase